MSGDESARLRSVLIRFHERLDADAAAGRRPSLKEYLDLFPGFEVEIAGEYLRLRAEDAHSTKAPRSADDPMRFGPYRLIHVLGRGGQGVVYKAEDTRLGRLVALKMLAPGYDSDAGDLLRRFKREAEAASRLDHPGICAVYETGSQDGVPFIAMRFVEGEPLSSKISAARKRRDAGGSGALDLVRDGAPVTDGLPTVLLDGGTDGDVTRTVDTFAESYGSGRSLEVSGKGAPERTRVLDDSEGVSRSESPARDTKVASASGGPSARDATPDVGERSADGISGSPRRSPSRSDVMVVVKMIEEIARALHVAHEAGIVHRDIKPGNVMIQEGGEPVILDFGLARGESTEVTLTRTGELFGTLPYMAPEQLRDRDAGKDPRSDVYALGVTAYECLALVRPFSAPTQEALFNAILERDPPALRGWNPAVPRDLEIVIETALEKDTGRRYRTALAFADELRRVREREPIVARPAGAVLRLWRWAQRNPSLAVSSAVILVLLASWIVRLRGDVQREKEETARRLAEAERATRRFDEGRRLARSFFEGVYDEVLDLPGSTRARKIMVSAALRYLDGLKEDATDALALQKELFDGYRRVAQVQGDPGVSHLGDFTGALESLGKARTVLRAIMARESTVAHRLADVSLTLREVDVLRALGRVREAEAKAAEAVRRSREARAASDDQRHRDQLGAALASHSRTLMDLGRVGDAGPLIEEARALVEGARPDHPVIVLTEEQQADIAFRSGDSKAAAATQRSMLDRARMNLRRRPQAVSLRREVAQRLLALARFEEELAGISAALERTREAVGIIEDLVAADDHDLRARRELAQARVDYGRRLIVAGRTADGHREIEKALAVAAEVQAADTNNRDFSVRFAASRGELGETLLWMGRVSLARDHLAQSLERLIEIAPDDGSGGWQPPYELASAWRRMGHFHFQADDMKEARRHYTEGVRILRSIVGGLAEDKLMSELAIAIDEVADTLMGDSDANGALALYRESMAMRQRLHDENPANLTFMRNLGISHFNVGRTLNELGERVDALRHMRKALEFDRKLAAADPSNQELVANLAISEYKLGRMLAEGDGEEDGRRLIQSSVDRIEALFARDPDNKLYARDLVPCLQALAVSCARLEDWTAAIKASERLLEILAILRKSHASATWYVKETRVCLERLVQMARARGEPEDERKWRLRLRRFDADRPDADAAELASLAIALVDSRTPEDLRDVAAALTYANRAVTAAGKKDPTAYEALSRVLEAADDERGAAGALRRALGLLPEGDSRRASWKSRLRALTSSGGGKRP